MITDVERIAPCLPGAQLQEIEGDTFRGVVKIKLGSITPSFKGEAKFIERDDAAHHAVLKAQGRDTGGRGNASAEIDAHAESLSPTSTRVVVTTDLHITGKVAQFGRGIIGDVSKKLMAQFAGNLNTMLEDEPPPADEPPASAPATDEPSALGADTPRPADPPPATDATPATPATPATANTAVTDRPQAADQGPAAAPIAEPPQVRKIDSPATEPVDLAGVAGPAILKRVAPLLGALLVVLIFARRRRRRR